MGKKKKARRKIDTPTRKGARRVKKGDARKKGVTEDPVG